MPVTYDLRNCVPTATSQVARLVYGNHGFQSAQIMTGESTFRISEMRTSMLVEISLEACISLLSCHGTEAVEDAFARLRMDHAVAPEIVDAEV